MALLVAVLIDHLAQVFSGPSSFTVGVDNIDTCCGSTTCSTTRLLVTTITSGFLLIFARRLSFRF